MSELKSRPPVKQKKDLEAFISGAEEKTIPLFTPEEQVPYPWEEAGIREDVTKVYNLRLSEPYLLKLKYIAEHTPNSMQKFCLKVVQEAIDKEIAKLTE
jgi:hypothetical protein